MLDAELDSDCESFRHETNRIVKDLETAQANPALLVAWNISQDWSKPFARLQHALNNAVTVGRFDPALALEVLHKVRLAVGPGKVATFNKSSDGPELLDHVERLAGFGMFTLSGRNLDRSMLTTDRGLLPEGEQWYEILRRWDINTPFLKAQTPE